jgi:hypothetical protein
MADFTLTVEANAYSCNKDELQPARFVDICGRTTTRSPLDKKSILSSSYYAYLRGMKSEIEMRGIAGRCNDREKDGMVLRTREAGLRQAI